MDFLFGGGRVYTPLKTFAREEFEHVARTSSHDPIWESPLSLKNACCNCIDNRNTHSCLIVLAFAVILNPGYVAASKVNYVPAEDGTFRVRATFKAPKAAEVVFNEKVKKGQKVSVTLPNDATDGDMLLTPAGVAFAPSLTEYAVVQGSRGNLTMADLNTGIFALIGSNTGLFPVLNNDTASLFIGVDLTAWLPNETPFSAGDIFTFSDGTSAQLPGFLIGTQAISFDSQNGFTTTAPFTGSAEVLGTGSVAAIPEPTTLLAIALSLATLSRRARRLI